MKTTQKIIIILGLAGFLAGAGPASSKSLSGVAENPATEVQGSDALGSSWPVPYQTTAEKRTWALCLLRQCQSLRWLNSPCGAIVSGANGEIARAAAFSHADAERLAMDDYGSNWSGCELICSVCPGSDEP